MFMNTVWLLVSLLTPTYALPHSGAQWVNLQRLGVASSPPTALATAATSFPSFTFTQPLDHFSDTGFTWNQSYWVSYRHYKPGGPVIVIDGGEAPGIGRLSDMDTGIADILANATGGLGVVLEHRYYGNSVPVSNFSTDSLRWLNIDQALADSANLMSHVKFPNITEDLTAPNRPWIYYGGSYAGARAAHMKVRYPDLVFGAIASSGVTYASATDWQYYDSIRHYTSAECAKQIELTVEEVDSLVTNPQAVQPIKELFGLPNVTHIQDVVSVISNALNTWQGQSWESPTNSSAFAEFCDALGRPTSETVEIARGVRVNKATIGYAIYVNQTLSSMCPSTSTQDECFGTFDPASFQATDLSQTWRPWQFQVCTQFGSIATAPPPGVPRVISKLLDFDYTDMICKFSFPPGEHFAIPPLPDISAWNAFGGLNIAADRLAIIDGQDDPWRPNTPHSDNARPRPDTILRPFKLIPGGVHCYDEAGLANHSAEPPTIRAIHEQEVDFVQKWLKDFKPPSRP